MAGWQDIPHPYSWVVPYLLGTYSRAQNLPSAMQDAYQNKINTCLPLIGNAAQTCYEDIQNTVYQDVPDIFLAQARLSQYVSAEVRGFYSNYAQPWPYFYTLSKGPKPDFVVVSPGTQQSFSFSSLSGTMTVLDIPVGAVTQTLTIGADTAGPSPTSSVGFMVGNFSFALTAYQSGTPLDGLEFSKPVTITISYTEQDLGNVEEQSLLLLRWNGSAWEDAACGDYVRNTAQNSLQVPICHLSKFALGNSARGIFLPLVARNN